MSLLTRPKKTVATVVVATDGSGDYNTDGTADNVQIQAAIDSLPANGGCIYIKEGIYSIDATITIVNSNVSVIGCGNSTQLVPTGAIDVFTLGDGANAYLNIILENFYLYGNATGNRGIFVNTLVHYSRIIKLRIYNFEQEAIYFNGPTNGDWIVSNNIMNSNGDVTFPHIYLNSLDASLILNNIFIAGGSHIVVHDCSSIIISSNFSGPSIYGFYLDGSSKCIINNNRIIASGLDSIRILDSSENIIEGNNINNGGGDGIEVSGNSDRNSIVGNICENCDWGINISAATCNDNLITNNILDDNSDGTITDSGTGTQIFNNIET